LEFNAENYKVRENIKELFEVENKFINKFKKYYYNLSAYLKKLYQEEYYEQTY